MSEREPKMPKTQASTPVSRQEPRDLRDERRKPMQADHERGQPSRSDEDAAGGDRGIIE